MDLVELPPLPAPEPVWPYRLWSLIHLASALAFVVFIYFTGPSWPGLLMAFIVGVNITLARYYTIFGSLIERGNRSLAGIAEAKESFRRLAASLDVTESTDRQ